MSYSLRPHESQHSRPPCPSPTSGVHSDSRPITSWQIDGETVSDFIFLGSNITADCDCSHEIKRCLLFGMEKAMAPHSSTLAWKIPWVEEPGVPQSMGLLRVRQDSATSLSLFTFLHWRRQWQPTPVFLPGESQGQGSLMGCRLWGRTESDTTEVT